MDKKGALGTAPVILQFFAYFLLVAIMLITLITFNNLGNAHQASIDDITSDIEQSTFLMSYLKTEVDFERTGNIAELIALFNNDLSYKDELEKHTEEAINDFFEGEYLFNLDVNEKSVRNYGLTPDDIPLILKRDELIKANTIIPGLGDKKSIVVNLTIYTKFVEQGTWCFNPAIQRCNKDRERICECNRVGYRLLWECKQCEKGCDTGAARCK